MLDKESQESQTRTLSLETENQELKRLLAVVMEKQARSEKMGRVFHDFNNMLSSTMGYATLAIERGQQFEDEKLQRYLGNIERASIRARDLVRDCLEQRQREREVDKPCELYQELLALGLNVQTESESEKHVKIPMSAEDVALLVNFLTPGQIPGQTKVQMQQVAMDNCELCHAELPPGALRVHFDSEAMKNPDSNSMMDLSLAAAMVNMSGGHMCSTENSVAISGISYFRALNLDET